MALERDDFSPSEKTPAFPGSAHPTPEMLQEKERELRELQRLSRVAMWEWDVEKGMPTWSREFYQILGVPEGTRPSLAQLAQLLSRESYRELRQAVATARETGEACELDLQLAGEASASRWVRIRAEAIRDENGRIVQLRGTAQDITEMKRAADALRESEERFRFATRTGHMFAYEWDVHSDLIVRSDEAVEIFGEAGACRTTGQATLAKIHPKDRRRALAVAEELTPDNPTYRMTLRELRADGEIIWLERTGRGFFDADGQLVKIIGMAVDVTDRKKGEDIVRESEEKFRSVFRDAVVGMMIISLDGHFLEANESFCEALGYSESELRQKSIDSLIHPEDWPVLQRRLRQLIQKGTGFRGVAARCIRKDGQAIHTESSASLIRDAKGRPRCIVGEVLNVSERKKAEETLSTINRRLIEAQEQERVRIARELHDDITQRMALVTVELEEVARGARLSPALLRRLRKLRQQTEEIASDVQLISHRLHSSKLEHLGIVAAAKSACDEVSRKQKVNVTFSHGKLSPQVSPEVSLSLFRVLQEALHNAVKHSGAEKIEVRLFGTQDEIELIIADQGRGFAPDSLSSQRGIGLLAMRERIALVGGTLAISSAPGRGTTVEARVPCESRNGSGGKAKQENGDVKLP